MRIARGAVVATSLVLLAGCTGYPLDGDTSDDLLWDQTPAPDPPVEPAPVPGPAPAWVCVYSPTYDEDWHNDVECSDGVTVDRPSLREWDDFVTEDEIMQSAREYEDALNAGDAAGP